MNTTELAPLPLEQQIDELELSFGLDYYKPTMSQLAYEEEPDAEVTFTFKNRGEQRLLDYVDPAKLQATFDTMREKGWTEHELSFYASLTDNEGERIFSDQFIDYLRTSTLPPVEVGYDEEIDDITIETTGPWALVTYWETIVMSQVNEQYFENYLVAHNMDPIALYEEGDRRLSEKIAILQSRPDIKFSDFGTRRHFSLAWQQHVLGLLIEECPDNLIGTSNVGLAHANDLKPVGTFAHEMMMVYAGLADARGERVRDSHGNFLDTWRARYGEELSIALTDTFTTDFFFEDFTREQAEDWRGVRHDSGDPIEFGERLIAFYESHGIDPTTKTLVFSDGLDIDTIVKLQDHFGGRIGTLYGWGTTLMNDLGIETLNIVMKATRARDMARNVMAYLVKLSDNPGKEMGPPPVVHTYKIDENYFATHEYPLAA